jgi:hypothetical protein
MGSGALSRNAACTAPAARVKPKQHWAKTPRPTATAETSAGNRLLVASLRRANMDFASHGRSLLIGQPSRQGALRRPSDDYAP